MKIYGIFKRRESWMSIAPYLLGNNIGIYILFF